ncbi:LacI family transcriptional regulator [Alkalihalobacillus alcalophilus ATCC 27647 = CGMCC 1.3604]|uniref:LacI family transcriptional regulator n=1 Tax=Alkalihalobacillus alcalophilus ATCC 27647 = CGMCC 1.3604 TaxID=1218173 RepID=A0A094WPX4_ALKAL|nr:LacI family DNA-binding transcriptional regulator [Alkalihalobacillus alcalophilus]KGA98866.1 LacI family transcriptional regulator [Alkalihalobacillus alcalophilus ATCC 27647 = CGMCC 1.3604]MED1564338.1 LacI family DNA-binding transcriptional regulator [Alkalihalobacillus alcalophilus]THG91717.1 LacI family transcriptional regulator [Alkalihalobacillus alcalophilus ATCC 27647 = CGMCC 1.3604]
MGTRKDVAKQAGVSEATVSRVFNNVPPIREETKQKVLEAAKQLNYHPNALAQNFAKGKSQNIGVIVPYLPKVRLLSTYYFSEILSGIGVKLGEMNYRLLLLFQSPHKPRDYVHLFQTQKVDGCIILGSQDFLDEKAALERLHQLALPYCLVNQTYTDYPFHSIDAMHYKGSYEAVSLLLQKGLTQIAFLNGPANYSNSLDRLAGYRDALQDNNIKLNEQWIFQGNYSRKSGYQAAANIGSHLSEIEAIFASNDRMAVGLMQGLREQGYQAGQDYALIGYDDSDIVSMLTPQLASVNVPLFEMGQLAAEKVLSMITEGIKEQVQIKLPVTVMERESIQVNFPKKEIK